MNVLEVKDVTKSFGKTQILKGVDFTVGEKEIVGFLGPNGSGKSTTIKCICGLYEMTGGSVEICGHDIKTDRTEALKHLGASIESPALYPQLTGREHLKMMASWRGIKAARVKEMEEYTGLGHYLNKRASQYSMGMKMRLMLAMTLMARPDIIILDEPTNGLDPQAVFELREQMEQIRRAGSSILFSCHQLEEVEKLSDRVVILNHGEKIYDGKLPKDLAATEYQVRVNNRKQTIAIGCVQHCGIRQCGEVEGTDDMIYFYLEEKEKLGQIIAEIQKDCNVYEIEKCHTNLEEFYKKIYAKR